jgi:hypothetical protein
MEKINIKSVNRQCDNLPNTYVDENSTEFKQWIDSRINSPIDYSKCINMKKYLVSLKKELNDTAKHKNYSIQNYG